MNKDPVVPLRPVVGVETTGLPVILAVVAEVATTDPAVFWPVALYLTNKPSSAEVVV